DGHVDYTSIISICRQLPADSGGPNETAGALSAGRSERLSRVQDQVEGAMRHRYLVCYDVADPRRLQRTHKRLIGFGQPVQYSVFVCDLSPTDRVRLEEALTAIVNLKEDR